VHFQSVPIAEENLIGPSGWYLSRPGFWNGACGPAACWAGGAAGLLNYARSHARENPHDIAHLGRMHANMWAAYASLEQAGREIDADPQDAKQAQIRALALRHTIEQLCTNLLQHFGRAYGPRPLAFEEEISRRYREVELYVRQSHAERDLESLGRGVSRKRERQVGTASDSKEK
jgi:alkylation response protein AidB-like acyl-CoA dehydrogenase